MENLELKSLFGSVYNKKKVFLTGHTGFKGSWLLLWLQQMRANVVGYSLPPDTTPNHISLIDNNYENIFGDICDYSKLHYSILKHKPEIIFHLAAQPLVLKSYEDPINTFQTNIMGTANLLEICRKCSFIKAVVIVTSDKCYFNNENLQSYKEDDHLGGKDPYSASKACSEIITKSYQESFFPICEYKKKHNLLITTARAGNVIGGGDWADNRIIPDIIKATYNKKPLYIRNPQSIRPWQFVLESLSGYLSLGQKLLEEKAIYAQSWNFGPIEKETLTVYEMLNLLQKDWQNIKYKIVNKKEKKLEANFLRLDSSKANKYLGWKPVYSIEQTLKETVIWYKNYYTQNKIVSLNQLSDYINSAKSKNIEWSK
ncbi:MAG: CDP-glucose 4,6-dehydratase [Parachlamydiales bacterium]|nr:CDP-glucose 4,6-dehydratase [Parachlamydiales bacterium]